MTDYAMTQIIKAHEKLKAQKVQRAPQPKTSTAPAKKTELSQAEIDKYVAIISQAAEGFVPEAKHNPNTSLLDQIIRERLLERGITPAE